MPFGTITSTENTFGSLDGTVNCVVPGTLTGSVGVPGAPGVGVPTGGTAGQFLTKTTTGVDYATGWTTLSLAGYATESWVTAGFYPLVGNPSGFLTSSALTPYLQKAGGTITGDIQSNNNSAYRSWDGAYNTTVLKGDYLQLTNSDIGGNALTVEWNGITFPSGKQTVHYPGASILSGYATESWTTSNFAPIAAGQPTSGTVGQVLTKQSGTSYDSAWATLIPGDRYLTSSTTSLTIDNANKTLTVGTGLSYSSQQDIVISYDATHHMHAQVLTYNSGTGVMTVDVLSHTGTGTFAAWTVNVGGTTPLQSVYWGEILGTLGDQSDLATALNAKLETSGGALTGSVTNADATYDSEFAGWGLGVQQSSDHTKGTTVEFNGLDTYDGASHMQVTPTGLTFPDSSTQTVAYPGTAGFLLKADNLSGLADTAVSRTNLGLGTMSTATAADYSTTTVANGLYYPLSGNPSSFLVAADISGKADLSGATFTGEVSTPASTTSSAGFSIQPGTAPSAPQNGEIWNTGSDLQVRLGGVTETLAEQSWVTSQGYLTSSALTPYAPLAGATFTGLVTTVAASAATAGLNIPHGAAPTTPVNGDIWTTTAGVFARINAGTTQLMNLGSTQTVSGNITFSNASQTLGNSTATGTINVASGATISASTKTVNVATGGVSGSTTNTTIGPVLGASTINIGNTTAASTLNLATGATLTATTKAVNIGTSGVAGSTTNIAIGSTTGTSTTTLQGTTNGITAAADTNTTQLATTAFVIGQAGSATPIVDGTAAVGTSLRFARQDHVHPTDTSRAPLASPSLTGVPLSTTAAADTNTTQIATTAFVVGQASSTAPVIDGTATVGTSLKYARADHVHPTDTSRAPLASPTFTGTVTIPAGASISGFAPLASPAFTGTPSLPTGTTAVTQTAGNNTTAVATTAFVAAAIPTNSVKAWVNFNGTGTVAIRASMNVSSITDNGVGDYTVNFTTALADANYSSASFAGDAAFSVPVTTSGYSNYSQTESALRYRVSYSWGGASGVADASYNHFQAFR